jgi:hypothetical protein
VATIVNRDEDAGWSTVEWDGRGAGGHAVATGTYFLRLESEGQVQVRKVLVTR